MPERLPSGSYRAAVTGRDGRVHRRTFPTWKLAKDWADDERAKIRAGKFCDPAEGQRPFAEYAARWLQSRTVETTTAHAEKSKLQLHVTPYWGTTPIAAIRPSQVDTWIAWLGRKHEDRPALAPGSIHTCHWLFSAILEMARRDDVIPDNPARGTTLPKLPPAPEVYLTRAEVAATAAAAATDFDGDVILALAYSGMRWGELAGLPAKHVDLDTGRVNVRQTLIEVSGEPRRIKPYPKGRRRRVVPVNDTLGAVLERRLAGRDNDDLVFQRPRTLVRFANGGTKELTRTRVGEGPLRRATWGPRVWHAATLAALGRDDVRVHDLRHTHASWLVQAGVPLYEVQRVLGHASITTTQRYAHLADDYSRVLHAIDGGAGEPRRRGKNLGVA